jgi:hypothetical protein
MAFGPSTRGVSQRETHATGDVDAHTADTTKGQSRYAVMVRRFPTI